MWARQAKRSAGQCLHEHRRRSRGTGILRLGVTDLGPLKQLPVIAIVCFPSFSLVLPVLAFAHRTPLASPCRAPLLALGDHRAKRGQRSDWAKPTPQRGCSVTARRGIRSSGVWGMQKAGWTGGTEAATRSWNGGAVGVIRARQQPQNARRRIRRTARAWLPLADEIRRPLRKHRLRYIGMPTPCVRTLIYPVFANLAALTISLSNKKTGLHDRMDMCDSAPLLIACPRLASFDHPAIILQETQPLPVLDYEMVPDDMYPRDPLHGQCCMWLIGRAERGARDSQKTGDLAGETMSFAPYSPPPDVLSRGDLDGTVWERWRRSFVVVL
ncbi:hypothetical protein BDK51DRAFT_44323 [Blyttiomyces helicus]|uniref:Uncharacterized protein n=1 Tax=Blyttiomyces helicus TaxID=388810 RepID=A0A4P9WHQ9_9FUNG|nr:hypothetical protein BDK51DRAFT_44323 [Blyttiomyces helicus]|eukprot:RKO90968.1 hypothetical protein BDK51DRAFT_44323 [Blyttiomyces helicus]